MMDLVLCASEGCYTVAIHLEHRSGSSWELNPGLCRSRPAGLRPSFSRPLVQADERVLSFPTSWGYKDAIGYQQES